MGQFFQTSGELSGKSGWISGIRPGPKIQPDIRIRPSGSRSILYNRLAAKYGVGLNIHLFIIPFQEYCEAFSSKNFTFDSINWDSLEMNLVSRQEFYHPE